MVVQFKPGMLSSDSKEYLKRTMRLNGDVDQDSREYEKVREEVSRAIEDFCYLGPIPSFSLDQFIDNETVEAVKAIADEEMEVEEIAKYADPLITMIGLFNLKHLVVDEIPEGSEVEKISGFRDPPIDIYEILEESVGD